MKEGFYFAEYSPDPFGGARGFFPWFRVVHKHPAGQETPVMDFIFSQKIAQEIAHKKNLDVRA